MNPLFDERVMEHDLKVIRKVLQTRGLEEELINRRLRVLKETIVLDGSGYLYELLEEICGPYFDELIGKLLAKETQQKLEEYLPDGSPTLHSPVLPMPFPLKNEEINVAELLKNEKIRLKASGVENIKEHMNSYRESLAKELLEILIQKLEYAPYNINDILLLEKARLKVLGARYSYIKEVLENINSYFEFFKKDIESSSSELPNKNYFNYQAWLKQVRFHWKYIRWYEEINNIDKPLVESLILEWKLHITNKEVTNIYLDDFEKSTVDTAGDKENYIRKFFKELRRILVRRLLEKQLFGFYDLLKDLYGDEVNHFIEKIITDWNSREEVPSKNPEDELFSTVPNSRDRLGRTVIKKLFEKIQHQYRMTRAWNGIINYDCLLNATKKELRKKGLSGQKLEEILDAMKSKIMFYSDPIFYSIPSFFDDFMLQIEPIIKENYAKEIEKNKSLSLYSLLTGLVADPSNLKIPGLRIGMPPEITAKFEEEEKRLLESIEQALSQAQTEGEGEEEDEEKA